MEWQVDFWRRARRVRYSCLKEAVGEEASMQIQWCCRDERLGESVMGLTGVQMAWFDCSLRAKVSSQELGVGQPGHTTPAGDAKRLGERERN
jgi:hypothetical protein